MRTLPAISVAALLAASCSGGSSQATRPTAPAPTTPPASEDPRPASPVQKPAAPVVTGAGSRFTVPDAPTTKPKRNGDSVKTCFGFLDAGFTSQYCDQFTSKLGSAVAMVETKGNEERSLVWRISGSNGSLVLRSVRTVQSSDGSSDGVTTRVHVADLANDSTPKALFLTPLGTDYDVKASVDVVEASGKVVIHRDLHGGNAGKAFGEGLETIVPATGDRATKTIIQFRDGAWRITSQTTVSSTEARKVEDF